MKLNRFVCMVLVCMMVIGTISVSANATETENTSAQDIAMVMFQNPLATESFSLSIPAKTNARADSSFPLVSGETITIKASYAPFDASVDFGVVAPNGKYYYFNITNGSIDKTIKVSQSGNYTFQIINHSDCEVEVSGFVNY